MVKINKEAHVPLLIYDLGYEETILQLIKSLDCLDKVVERVFEHVRGNISKQKSEIVLLNDRLSSVTDKVQRLSRINKSVQVYSSSKYPATHCHKDYDYSYDFDVSSDIIENIQVDHKICVSRNIEDKLTTYNEDEDDQKIYQNKDIIQKRGLGSIPDSVKYVNSLLLFNSNENLFKNYVLSNPYKVSSTPTSKQVDNIENINKPVFSLPLNDTENQFNFSYTPVYEEVPSIDVPADLPDLPGIAGDVQYFKEEENVETTSDIFKPSTVVDLPNFDELDLSKDDETVTDNMTEPIVQELVKTEQETTVSSIVTKTDFIEDVKPVKSDQNVNKINDNVNTHSVLMDEIRNAGGLQKAKLRSVSDRKTNSETISTGNDLMDDLHKKLAMRRQGISGNNKKNDSDLEGVFYQMSLKMLPPEPESENEADGNDDTEGDWDD